MRHSDRYTGVLPVLLALVLVSTSLIAQERRSSYAESSFGAVNSQASFALSWQTSWALGKSRKFEIGTGIRFTANFGINKYYRTSPPEITRGTSGPSVLFRPDIRENIDSLFISQPKLVMTNVMFSMQYKVHPRWQLGFNIDLLGFSAGGKATGTYIHNQHSSVVSSKPTSFNYLLIDENDKGNLNSEIYARYNVRGAWYFKIAYQHLITEYTTAYPVQTTPALNDRFRNKASLISVGLVLLLNRESDVTN